MLHWCALLYWFAIYCLFPFIKIYHRASREGLENVPWKGPFIIVANHSSFMDPWYLSILFRRRIIHYLTTTDWYYKSKLWQLFFWLNGCIPVTKGKFELSAMKLILQTLKKGGIIGIFPEGGIGYDSELREFNAGAVSLAMRAKVPVIPAAICGAFEAFPRHTSFPRPKKIKIIIGKPIHFPPWTKGDNNETGFYEKEMQKIKEWIGDQIEQFRKSRQPQ